MTDGFAAIPNWIVRSENFTAQQKPVYMVLSSHIGQSGTWAMSHADIAREAGIGVTSVRAALTALREHGLVDWLEERDARSNAQLSNRYSISVIDPQTTPPRHATPPRQATGAPSSGDEQKKNPVEEPVVHTREAQISAADAEFDSIWQAWPRKVSKVAAIKAWKKLSRADRDAVLAAIADHANSYREYVELQYTPHLSTWLNQRRWEEQPPAAPAPRAPQPHSALPASETSRLPKYDYSEIVGYDEWEQPIYRRIN